jgi:hypothetical protein
MQKFISLAELSREAGIPASRIQAAVEAGLIQTAGRAGRHPNSPILFLGADVASIKATLSESANAPSRRHAVSAEGRRIKAKLAALAKARRETLK